MFSSKTFLNQLYFHLTSCYSRCVHCFLSLLEMMCCLCSCSLILFFQMLLSDFSHHHIEMACTLLETCGRFLFRSPESHLRTSVLLVRACRNWWNAESLGLLQGLKVLISVVAFLCYLTTAFLPNLEHPAQMNSHTGEP